MRPLQNSGQSPQELLWLAHRRGVSIRLNEQSKLRLSPAAKVTPGMAAAVKARKPELLTLVADLERYGATDDPLILEALALFNGTLKDWQSAPRMPFPASRMREDCTRKPDATQTWLKLEAA